MGGKYSTPIDNYIVEIVIEYSDLRYEEIARLSIGLNPRDDWRNRSGVIDKLMTIKKLGPEVIAINNITLCMQTNTPVRFVPHIEMARSIKRHIEQESANMLPQKGKFEVPLVIIDVWMHIGIDQDTLMEEIRLLKDIMNVNIHHFSTTEQANEDTAKYNDVSGKPMTEFVQRLNREIAYSPY